MLRNVLAAAALALLLPVQALAGTAPVAALQTGLHARGLYAGPIDGVAGARTTAAVRRLQRKAGLAVDGVAGPQTRRALGRFGRPAFGSRVARLGQAGWDVAVLQWELARHGFPSGAFDGVFGLHLETALRHFQDYAGLPADGRAGSATLAALRGPLPRSPLRLAWPLQGELGDRFGPRGDRWHAGLDIKAPLGAPVQSAAAGRVTWAGRRDGGWGYLVVLDDGSGVRTLYAHLSRVEVALGERVPVGALLGAVGATGDATGPHLHFEVRVRGAALDPLSALD